MADQITTERLDQIEREASLALDCHQVMDQIDPRDTLCLVSLAREALAARTSQGAETEDRLDALAQLEKIEIAARDLNAYLTWQLSSESPGHHPTFPSAVAAFRWAFAPEVFASGFGEFNEWQSKRRRTARVAPEPVARWTPIKQTPEAGGTYVVGGYVDDGALRTFRRCFARLVRTLNGPEWSYCDPEKDSVIPMSFWCDLPPHPEHAAPASPSIASPGREGVLWRALDALESTEALDNRENCPECEGEGEPEICPVCFPAADDARIKRRNAIAAIRALTNGETHDRD